MFGLDFVFVLIIIINQLDTIQNEEREYWRNTSTEAGKRHHNQTCELVSNFSVSAFMQKQPPSSYISLNLSWDQIQVENNTPVDIEIHPEEGNEMCAYWLDFSHNLVIDEYYVIRPGANPEYEIYPDCNYNVSIEKPDTGICTIIYHVPECVGMICNCEKFGPQSKILEAKVIEEQTVLVKWDPGIVSPNGAKYSLTRIQYNLLDATTRYGAPDFVDNDYELHQSIVKEQKLIKGLKYSLIGKFFNNYSCYNEVHFTFTVDETRNIRTLFIVLIVAAVVFAVALNYKIVIKYGKKTSALLLSSWPRYSLHEQPRLSFSVLETPSIPMTVNFQYTPVEIINGVADKYEFPRNRLFFIKILDSGAFGTVFLGKAFGIEGVDGYRMVAIKTLGDGSKNNVTKEAASDFIAEIEIFKKIGHHPNIVKLMGCCTLEPPYQMIMEFVPCGNLKNYLTELRNQWLHKKTLIFALPDISDGAYIDPNGPKTPTSITSSRLPSTSETVYTNLEDPISPLLPELTKPLDAVLDHVELQNFAFQIAKGMAHLESIPITHRDLAARNILINELKVLKISDFGMSRMGPYINHKRTKLPLRWLAPESLQSQTYNNKSDVWSFGIVLWEIGTLGAFPYEKIHDSFVQQSIQTGTRLERPEICTDHLYDLMQKCWEEMPENRPSFAELVEALDVKKKKIYVDFSQLNPTYVFPPSEVDFFIANTVVKC